MTTQERIQIEISDIEKILEETWGNDSILSHIYNPILVQPNSNILEQHCIEEIIDHTLVYPMLINGEVGGVIGLKIVDEKTVEVGNIAMKKCFRGNGYSSTLYELIEKDLNRLVYDLDFNIVTYATVGSPVLFKIIENIECTLNQRDAMFPMNIAPYIIPVSTNDICEPFSLHNGRSNYNSTLEIQSLRQFHILLGEKNTDERFREFFKLFQHLLPISETIGLENSYFELPINMDILTIHELDTNIEEVLDDQRRDKPIQIRIPISNKYSDLVHNIFKSDCIFTGITISNGNTYFCFMKNISDMYLEMINRIGELNIPKISQIMKIISKIN